MSPKLVLLPGTDGTGKLFHRFLASCELESQVVSYSPTEALGYAELEAFVLGELPKTTPFVLVAESFSGPIATSIASKNPKGLAGLVLCASFVVSPVSYLRVFSPLAHILPTALPSKVLSAFLMGRFRSDALVKETHRCLQGVSPTVLKHRLREVLGVDYREKMRKVTVPAMYLRATEDRVVPQGSSRQFSKCCSHGEVVDVEAPHFLLQCCPQLAAGHIERFVRRHANAF